MLISNSLVWQNWIEVPRLCLQGVQALVASPIIARKDACAYFDQGPWLC